MVVQSLRTREAVGSTPTLGSTICSCSSVAEQPSCKGQTQVQSHAGSTIAHVVQRIQNAGLRIRRSQVRVLPCAPYRRSVTEARRSPKPKERVQFLPPVPNQQQPVGKSGRSRLTWNQEIRWFESSQADHCSSSSVAERFLGTEET